MTKKKLRFGPEATKFLVNQTKSLAPEQRKPDTYPARYLRWLGIASETGYLRLELKPGKKAYGTVLELRRLCRALIDQNHPSAYLAHNLKILPPKDNVLEIVRRDADLDTVVEYTERKPAEPTIGEERNPNALAELERDLQREAEREEERNRFYDPITGPKTP